MTNVHQSRPFEFCTSLNLTLLTNRRARDLVELLAHLRDVPGSVIYYHTHHFLVQHQRLSPEPPNDFAYWVTHVLQEDWLGEQLAAIDIVQFRTLRELRERLIALVEGFLAARTPLRTAPPGDEFFFRESATFVLPTSHRAANLTEFADCIECIGFGSLSLHFFDACLQLGKGRNDFSEWLACDLGEEQLARQIERIDPYTHTLEGLRHEVLRLVRTRIEEGR